MIKNASREFPNEFYLDVLPFFLFSVPMKVRHINSSSQATSIQIGVLCLESMTIFFTTKANRAVQVERDSEFAFECIWGPILIIDETFRGNHCVIRKECERNAISDREKILCGELILNERNFFDWAFLNCKRSESEWKSINDLTNKYKASLPSRFARAICYWMTRRSRVQHLLAIQKECVWDFVWDYLKIPCGIKVWFARYPDFCK